MSQGQGHLLVFLLFERESHILSDNYKFSL